MIKLSEILKQLGLYCEYNLDVHAINTLGDAGVSDLSFLDNKAYLSSLKNTQAGAVFVHPDYEELVPADSLAILCDEPYVTLAKATKLFAPALIEQQGQDAIIGDNATIQSNVYLGKNVHIGNNVTIMAGCYIGDNVSIGDDVVLYPNVSVYRDCHIGNEVMIHAGTVVGSDGFGFAISKAGEYVKIYQNGNVIIGSRVEIGANCTIDRAAFSSTMVEDDVRIDNLVHIAHNCVIGKRSILAGQVGLAGSTILAEQVIMGGQAAAAGHLSIAPFTTIAARGAVTKTLTEGGHYAGFPLLPHKTWLRLQGKIQRLLKD